MSGRGLFYHQQVAIPRGVSRGGHLPLHRPGGLDTLTRKPDGALEDGIEAVEKLVIKLKNLAPPDEKERL